MLKRWPLTDAGLHEVTIGSRISSRAAVYNFGDCLALPNYSFKPNPLRGIKCVPALRLHAFAATARVGLTQVLGGGSSNSFCVLSRSDRPRFSRQFFAAESSRIALRTHF